MKPTSKQAIYIWSDGSAVLVAVITAWVLTLIYVSGGLAGRAEVAASLFSALAFAGVLVTIWMQQHELALQRTELRLSRKEFKRQAMAQAETAAINQRAYDLQQLSLEMEALLRLSDNIVKMRELKEEEARRIPVNQGHLHPILAAHIAEIDQERARIGEQLMAVLYKLAKKKP